MYKSFAKIYVFVLIVWAVEKSECKQGGKCINLYTYKLNVRGFYFLFKKN